MSNYKKIKMNNKRSLISGEVIMFIPHIIYLIGILFAFVILVKTLIITSVDVREIEARILLERILFSRDGILYYDEGIERLYPGIIDQDKFDEIHLDTDKSYIQDVNDFNANNVESELDTDTIVYYDPNNIQRSNNILIAANITLIREGMPDISIYYNKKWYDRWVPKIGFSGPAGIKKFEWKRNVLVRDTATGIISFGTLSFTILS